MTLPPRVLSGRVAVVTGASSGLGARFASVLAQAGARVVACARRVERVEELARTQPGVVPVRCDVADAADRERLVEAALALDGRIDVLVNNAGVASGGREQQATLDAFAAVMRVNLEAAFALMQAVAPTMIAAGTGSIVNVSSMFGLVEEVAEDLRDLYGGDALAVPADVTDEGAVAALVAAAVDAYGTVDVLVNNAGTTLLSPLLEHSLDHWRQVVDVNLTGTFLAAREAARVMVTKRSGSIVNISSVFAMGATREYPVIGYYASKGGVEGLTKGLAVELGPHGVRVNAIAPGFFPSPMSSGMFANDEEGEKLRSRVLTPRTALPTLPHGADLRGAVRFLASDESAFVTGHTLVVDGGWRAF